MQQIDENKDPAIYNAYIDDRYKQHGTSPPQYYSQTHHRPYYSKRQPVDIPMTHATLQRTQSQPTKHYTQKTRGRGSYYHYPTHQQHPPFYSSHYAPPPPHQQHPSHNIPQQTHNNYTQTSQHPSYNQSHPSYTQTTLTTYRPHQSHPSHPPHQPSHVSHPPSQSTHAHAHLSRAYSQPHPHPQQPHPYDYYSHSRSSHSSHSNKSSSLYTTPTPPSSNVHSHSYHHLTPSNVLNNTVPSSTSTNPIRADNYYHNIPSPSNNPLSPPFGSPPTSPLLHIPSKAPASKAPKTPSKPTSKSPSKSDIVQIPSLLTKKNANKSSKIEPIATTKLNSEDPIDMDITQIHKQPPAPPDDDIINMGFKNKPAAPAFKLHRQYSEPDAKAIKDLNELPATPPFNVDGINHPPTSGLGGPDNDIDLGVPTGLEYSKTTPLSYDHENISKINNNYTQINDNLFYPSYDQTNDIQHQHHNQHHQPHNPYQQQAHAQHQMPLNYFTPMGGVKDDFDMNMIDYNAHPLLKNNLNNNKIYNSYQNAYRNVQFNSIANKKSKKKKKKNKKKSKNNGNTMNAVNNQQLWMGFNGGIDFTQGFDFAVHDLHQQLKMAKDELKDVEKQIADTDHKMLSQDTSLKKVKKEKKKMIQLYSTEKLVLQKSLDIYKDKGSDTDDDNDADDDQDDKDKGNKAGKDKVDDDNKNDNDDDGASSGNIAEYSDIKLRKYWENQSADLRTLISKINNKNMSTQVSTDVMHKHLRGQLENERKSLIQMKKTRGINREKNMQFELEVIELIEQVNNLKEQVDSQRHDNFLKLTKKREYAKQLISDNDGNNDNDNKDELFTEYPPEIVIQQALIRAQVEFYFSDYNLKRDKRLLEKICKEEERGYLAVQEVLSLSRVRQLCNSASHLYESLKNSPYIHMILPENEQKELDIERKEEKELELNKKDDKKQIDNDKDDKKDTGTQIVTVQNDGTGTATGIKEQSTPVTTKKQYHPTFVGRLNFTPPTEKQFPFRRSVYIYGLPWYCDEKYIYNMLNAFGGVTKVHFDHGPDTLDRQIMKKMLEKHRVYKLLSKDSAALTMEFNQFCVNKAEQYQCYWCSKQKPCSDGYYHPKRLPASPPAYRVCLQCAAAKSENQSQKYDARSKLLKDDKRLRELLLGLPPRPISQCKTALCVFASQRQASKCVYVRSRLSYNGAFATHYHHYSKLKKEIALSLKPKIKHLPSLTSSILSINTKHKQPSMLKTYTAPVYQQEGTNVIQPHLKNMNKINNKNK